MRWSVLGVGLLILSAGCDNENSPSQANQAVFTAQLLPSNEVPPVTNADAGASGNVTITFNLTMDTSGNITASTADFNAAFSGFPADTSLTAAHIHPGAAGAVGPPLVTVPLAAGDATFPNGSGTLLKTGISVPADVTTQIINNPSGYYFNVHTALNPAGAARGQLVRTGGSY